MLNPDTPTSREVDSAIEANLVTHMSWVQSRLNNAQVEVTREFVLVDSGLACDSFNFVVRARLGGDLEKQIARAIRFFSARGHPFSWWVGPLDEPRHLGEALKDAGLADTGHELGMILPLSNFSPVKLQSDDLRVVQAQSVKQLPDFAAVVAANWIPPDRMVIEYYKLAEAILLEPASPLRFYVGYLGDQAVTAAEVCKAGGCVGLYSVATLKEFRRKGYATTLLTKVLSDERDEGAPLAALQASEDGMHVYARMGFWPHGQYTEYQLR